MNSAGKKIVNAAKELDDFAVGKNVGPMVLWMPDNRPYTNFVFWTVAIGALVIAMAQVALLVWRMIDGWLGPF